MLKKFWIALFTVFCLFTVAAPALAETDRLGKPVFQYTFFGNTAGRLTIMNCDYAEARARGWMERFGAKDFDMTCTGGIQPFGPILPITLRIAYTAPVIPSVTHPETLVIDSGPYPSDTNCDFDTNLMQHLLPEFRNVVTLTRKIDACFEPTSHYRYDLVVTRPF